jgi:hypothetical protein
MAFDIRKYIEENKIELGSVKKEVGDSAYKGGHNDLRKTSYDVKLTEDGKLDLYTHKTIVTEGKKSVNEVAEVATPTGLGEKRTDVPKINLMLETRNHTSTSQYIVAKFFRKGDALIAISALDKASPSNYRYFIG